MSVPRRYRHLGDFHKYYSGASSAPLLTLVVGGNHEASNHLFELYHGGWLAPNVYYLGAAGVVRCGDIRVAGLSGIYASGDYKKPHGERLPYERNDVRSIYHVRECDVQKLLRVEGGVDVGLSHDWPAGIELFGDYAGLFRDKPHFLESAEKDRLGSKPAAQVLDRLRPKYWFAGHMHVRFAASVQHEEDQSLEDSMRSLSVDEELKKSLPIFKKRTKQAPASASASASTGSAGKAKTEFLALHKAGADSHEYMELLELDIPPRSNTDTEASMSTRDKDGKPILFYDDDWLAIVRAFAPDLRIADPETLVVPPTKPQRVKPASTLPAHRAWVKENIVDRGLLRVPDNFVAHAPVHRPGQADSFEQPVEYPSLQTAAFAELLGMENKFRV